MLLSHTIIVRIYYVYAKKIKIILELYACWHEYGIKDYTVIYVGLMFSQLSIPHRTRVRKELESDMKLN